ncbi:Ldh family oxidoreductase [Amycolatopsis sp. FDAARGOS 1241]|uniref:Ldh family oxidoreductase n=1 Tax=Amycolatopsis sp. FDAARGOS 1241 TaxID=2778070 RepID=UPI001950B362|nr:Ldh family oxidoreductase [Amycolatopsis sp. FDAARGOS 1241]QRP43469.1 Ldh family oxidoreductase [Amycolatopsis sp. FDAARGOS 1241]
MTGDTQITAEELRGLAARALAGNGMSEEDSARVADVLVLADLFGIRTHGVARIPQYLDRARVGGVDLHAKVTVEQVAPALSRVDGANGIGPLVGSHALDAALAGARATGLGAAFVRGSNHFGPVMPYLFRAAEQGFAAIIASNATTTIAPWGGREARLGNNPLGIGVPAPGGDPVLLDIAMSVAARAKIRAAEAAGEPIPDTWATDRDGKPTTDPAAALEGFLQPLGGHKGYGLSVMVDLFAGVLSGAGYLTRISSWSVDPDRPQNLGHVFFLIDATKLVPGPQLGERMADFADILHTTPPADPAQPVLLPGELELARYHRQLSDGVPVDDGVLARLSEFAGAVR